jgi:hypothetical protein
VPAPLPPLPPAFRVGDDDLVPAGRSMIDQLTDEHAQIEALCSDLRTAISQRRPYRRVAEVLAATLSRHLSIEEQYLYPTVRGTTVDGYALVDEDLAAGTTLLRTLKRFQSATDDDTRLRAVDAIGEQVRHHTLRATRELFPRLTRSCTPIELVRLGNRLDVAREAAPTRPHPATPVTPPANKVIDPCVGVVDKVRDVLTRRVTWPEDL